MFSISEKCQKDLKDEFRPQFWSNVQQPEVGLNILLRNDLNNNCHRPIIDFK